VHIRTAIEALSQACMSFETEREAV
jgi:hypothetical protein